MNMHHAIGICIYLKLYIYLNVLPYVFIYMNIWNILIFESERNVNESCNIFFWHPADEFGHP